MPLPDPPPRMSLVGVPGVLGAWVKRPVQGVGASPNVSRRRKADAGSVVDGVRKAFLTTARDGVGQQSRFVIRAPCLTFYKTRNKAAYLGFPARPLSSAAPRHNLRMRSPHIAFPSKHPVDRVSAFSCISTCEEGEECSAC